MLDVITAYCLRHVIGSRIESVPEVRLKATRAGSIRQPFFFFN